MLTSVMFHSLDSSHIDLTKQNKLFLRKTFIVAVLQYGCRDVACKRYLGMKTVHKLPWSSSNLRFYWSLRPAASTVIRVRGIFCAVSSTVSFSSHKQCLGKYNLPNLNR